MLDGPAVGTPPPRTTGSAVTGRRTCPDEQQDLLLQASLAHAPFKAEDLAYTRHGPRPTTGEAGASGGDRG